MTTSLAVVNEALIKLGASPIASLDDAGAQATAASALFKTTKDNLLAQTPWFWALKKVELARISLADGEFNEYADYSYVYQLPSDRIRLLGLETCERFRVMRDRLWTNDKAPVLLYVYDAPISAWPGYFREIVVDYLAGKMAISVTDSSSRANLWLSVADQGRVRAMSLDAQQTPVEVFALMQVYLRSSNNPLAVG